MLALLIPLMAQLAGHRAIAAGPPLPQSSLTQATETFSWEGVERSHAVHLPEGYDPSRTYPVLLALHGGFGSAEQFATSSGFDHVTDAHGFIVIYGQGTSDGPADAAVWNAGGCCGPASDSRQAVDDVGYAKEVVRFVVEAYAVDASRVYVTGKSNGAMMANRLACEASDVFHGAAAVSGTIQVTTCVPSRSLPILFVHGTADEHVPYAGGAGSRGFAQSQFPPVEQALADWAVRNGCTGPVRVETVVAQSDDGKTVDALIYGGCDAQTVLYRINGGGHEWPGGTAISNPLEKSDPSDVLDTSEAIANFFGI